MPIENNRVALLCWGAPSASERNAARIVEFMGAEVFVVSIASAGEAGSLRLDSSCAALIVQAETLARVADGLRAGPEGLASLLQVVPHVFVYGFESTERHAALLRGLSSGGLRELKPVADPEEGFWVEKDCRRWCGQFSGLKVRTLNSARDAGFVEGEALEGQAVLIRAAGLPFFVRIDQGKHDIFFAACKELADLDEPVGREASLLPWFSRLVPLMIFIKSALGNRAWHAERPQACFIIDDPLLRNAYGFLNYSKLLQAVRGQKFCMSVAFIPWNYRRSQEEIADLFSAAPSSLSLCIHGCDHTQNEFGTGGSGLLRDKARLALQRMRAHTELSGLPFDDVMVFPQGQFSAEGMAALDACGYLAAVNTGLCPSNAPPSLRLADLLDVAVTKFAGFPLFGRRYPKDVADFAFDLFLGKPALVVEHHGYFRKGYDELRTFVTQMNELDANLEWSHLAAICTRACRERVTSDGDILVQFYGNRFQLVNRGARQEQYLLSRRWNRERSLPEARLNGQQWPAERGQGDTVALRLSLDAGRTAEIEVFPVETASPSRDSWAPSKAHNTKVLIRRVLSETRDNFIDTNRVLSRMLSGARWVKTHKKSAKGKPAAAAGRSPAGSVNASYR